MGNCMTYFQAEKRRSKSPSASVVFSRLQLKIVSMPKWLILKWHILTPFTQTHNLATSADFSGVNNLKHQFKLH